MMKTCNEHVQNHTLLILGPTHGPRAVVPHAAAVTGPSIAALASCHDLILFFLINNDTSKQGVSDGCFAVGPLHRSWILTELIPACKHGVKRQKKDSTFRTTFEFPPSLSRLFVTSLPREGKTPATIHDNGLACKRS